MLFPRQVFDPVCLKCYQELDRALAKLGFVVDAAMYP